MASRNIKMMSSMWRYIGVGNTLYSPSDTLCALVMMISRVSPKLDFSQFPGPMIMTCIHIFNIPSGFSRSAGFVRYHDNMLTGIPRCVLYWNWYKCSITNDGYCIPASLGVTRIKWGLQLRYCCFSVVVMVVAYVCGDGRGGGVLLSTGFK